MCLINAVVFMLYSLVISVSPVDYRPLILLPNLLFLVGSLFVWLMMIRSGWGLTPICWFVLGAGVFFGFGGICGGLHANGWTEIHYGDSATYLIKANVLNSTSVFIVLFVGAFFVSSRKAVADGNCLPTSCLVNRIFSYLSICSLSVIALRICFFPDVENLVLRSILSKMYFLLPAVFVFFGMYVRTFGKVAVVLVSAAFALQTLYGFLVFSKYEILMPSVALLMGLWISPRSYRIPLAALLLPVVIFWIANPLVAKGRAHDQYHATDNTVLERFQILGETIFEPRGLLPPESGPKNAHAGFSKLWKSTTGSPLFGAATLNANLIERVRRIGVRFDVVSVQGFLMNEYDIGRPGDTLVDVLAVLVPRVIWPEKPVITRFGTSLNVKYHNNDPDHRFSAMAPTYSGEAYWNLGWFGVLAISTYLGICYGLFSQLGLAAAQGRNIPYLFIAYPLCVSAAFVESWITATYIGGVGIILLYYLVIKSLFSLTGIRYKNA